MPNPALVVPAVSTFPLSFDGNPWTFGSALFALTVVSSVSLATMGQLWAEARVFGYRFNAPHGAARTILFLLMLSFFMRSAPDVLFLLLWGGVGPHTIAIVLITKRWFDAISVIPFLGSALILIRARPPIVFQLTRQPLPVDLWPTWLMVRKNVGIIGLAMLIATGVTLAR